ncbi:hypothetical protein BRADI_4g16615v3 [Brachypodium distachyon]|uniref:Uncharacterized protein n=1 Tax=Brachypodium distachyon TaxID=15368 RepID=A0A0Q3EKW9_BRADI|nr:hypothetical protein BRADI_4g16615v3 [Brachypodium distachyon]PNT63487.1 hypothetical protein BRADI_4g16615v3 [Brachypodium distachyon]
MGARRNELRHRVRPGVRWRGGAGRHGGHWRLSIHLRRRRLLIRGRRDAEWEVAEATWEGTEVDNGTEGRRRPPSSPATWLGFPCRTETPSWDALRQKRAWGGSEGDGAPSSPAVGVAAAVIEQ